MNTALSVFIKPITDEFGWSRSTFAGAGTVGTVLGGVTALAIGPSIDRFGARMVLLLACVATGALFLLLRSIDGIWQFYLIIVGGRIILQGVLNVANNVVVAQWFVVRRGKATALSALGPRVGTGVLPFFAQLMVNGYGWRMAAASLGLVAWTITLLPVLLWLRRRPEDMRLAPDGRTPGAGEATTGSDARVAAARPVEPSYSLRQVLRFRGFYILLFGFLVSQFVSTGINFNLLPYLTDQGMSTTQAVTVLSLWSLIGIPGTLVSGYLADRIPMQYLLFGIFMGIALGVVILIFTDSLLMGLIFAAVHGSFFGSMLLFQALSFANYYGRTSLGAIRGFITPFLMFANALGPLAATGAFDATGSYDQILLVYAGLSAVGAVAMLLATPPLRRAPSFPPAPS